MGTLSRVAGEAVRLDEVQPAPVPGIAIGNDVVIVRRDGRFEEDALTMVDLDIVAQFAPIPIDMARGSVLIEIVVSKAHIDRKMNAARTHALLVALAELLQLGAFAGKHGLTAAVIGQIAPQHEPERRPDRPAGACKAARLPLYLRRPRLACQPVEGCDVVEKVPIRLAFFLAFR